MNQATNLIQYKYLTPEQKDEFDFENYKYEKQVTYDWEVMPNKFTSCVDNTIYRLVIEPDKWYCTEDYEGIQCQKLGSEIWVVDYTMIRPARANEIPKVEKIDFIADWLDANVWDGEDLSRCENLVSVTMNKVHLNPHALHELFTECFEFAIEKAKETEV